MINHFGDCRNCGLPAGQCTCTDHFLVEGGQGRKGESLTPNAVTVAVAIIGGAVLLAWAIWSCL